MDKQQNKHRLSHIMSRILEIRYTDLEEEKALCLEILKEVKGQDDMYAQAFAHTYLGDYYVGTNVVEKSGEHLLEALRCSELAGECDEITLRIYSLLGVYYKHKADEQNSIKYYLDALAIAEKIEDIWSKCLILNNMGFAFLRHNRPDLALEYFTDAYNAYTFLDDPTLETIFLSNIAETLIIIGKYEEALKHIKKCEQAAKTSYKKEAFIKLLWCFYYSKTGDVEQSIKWAEEILYGEDVFNNEKMLEFENYSVLFKCMLDIGHEDYARRFLALMEETSIGGGLDQNTVLEKAEITFSLKFEPEEKHIDAYRRFHKKTLEFKKEINAAISSSMKAKIELDELNRAKEKLRNEQKDLRYQYNVDELTKAYNRRFMDEYIQKKVEKHAKGDLGIIMLDVDYFKEYNDTYKHIMGDFVLKTVSECLNENKIDGIFCCRFGGDEFACICDDISLKQIEKFVVAVQKDLAQRSIEHKTSPCNAKVTLSIGIAYGKWEDNPYTITEIADQALYESKGNGRNMSTTKKVGVTFEQ